MISGGGNFPVRQKEKQNLAREKNMDECARIQHALDTVCGIGTAGINADDPQALEKLESKLSWLREKQEHMKAVNAYYRKHKTLDGCTELTTEQIAQLRESMSRDWQQDPVPFPFFSLSNNNAKIRAAQQRIKSLKNRPAFTGWSFAGGRIEANETENRLQLFFDEKPSAEQREQLKKSGFRWAPSQGAWQRQLTRNAIYAVRYIDFIQPETETPFQLQSPARQTVEASSEMKQQTPNHVKHQN